MLTRSFNGWKLPVSPSSVRWPWRIWTRTSWRIWKVKIFSIFAFAKGEGNWRVDYERRKAMALTRFGEMKPKTLCASSGHPARIASVQILLAYVAAVLLYAAEMAGSYRRSAQVLRRDQGAQKRRTILRDYEILARVGKRLRSWANK